MAMITGSVGENGVNRLEDVRIIQSLLNQVLPEKGGPSPLLTVDGVVGPKTISAIRKFQQHHHLPADARIDPNGQTLEKLNQIADDLNGGANDDVDDASSPVDLAKKILQHSNIILATMHVSGAVDNANAHQNIKDTADGLLASLSNYDNAPGGTIQLQSPVLNLMLSLAESYKIAISEIVGGSHSSNSRHYVGVAIDVNQIDDRQVNASHPDLTMFMQRCKELGCTEVLGPSSAGHATHIHAALPRSM